MQAAIHGSLKRWLDGLKSIPGRRVLIDTLSGDAVAVK